MTRGSALRSLASIVLGFELVVVFLGSLVAFGLGALPAPVALIGGAVVVVLMLVTLGLLKHRFAYVLGWVLQAVVLASGFVLPAMFVVGGIFTAMWAYAVIQGTKLDRLKRLHQNDYDETETSS